MIVLSLRARSVFFVASLLAITARCSSILPSFLYNGGCPNLTLSNNFDTNAFSGRWFEIAATKGNPYINSERCTYSDFTASGSSMDVLGRGVGKRNKAVTKEVTMTQDGGTARFTVTLPSTNSRKKPLISNFVVMGSDYTSYACVFACSELNSDISAHFAWVYSRTARPTNDVLALCAPALSQVEQNPSTLTLTPQGDSCSYA